jgi:carbamoyl-phosphate synthase large subunit
MTKQKHLFQTKGIRFLVSDEEFVLKCRDKRQIHDFFTSNRVGIAKEYEKNNYKLPLFIKPIDGSRSVDTYVINKESDLTQYHFENDKLMFLEYIDHKLYDEYTCDLYYNQNHTLKCVVPRKRVEVRDGEVNKGLTSNNEIVAYVKERLNYISGAIGCLTAQFFLNKTNGNIYGIEINPRFGGGFPLSYLAGANFPGWIIQEVYADKTVDDKFDVWEDNLLMLRYDDEILVHGYKG